ncbi:hypothetical protein CFOL_v3_04601 [Cephalotus follicularis]|uniref:Uncharacterized protein n=1 Tax=Cephalotus follicularis TaxID=3775 RepID=A0A1Q3AZU5_CEPFO|nr:hypothetical protein CFOL_v3_04601 [Cephalotus follicularis]
MQPLEPVGPLSTSFPKPSIEEPPKLELKELPSSLKYSFLCENQTLPVVLSSDLTLSQEKEVIHLLKENKEALGWTMADIKCHTLIFHYIRTTIYGDIINTYNPAFH